MLLIHPVGVDTVQNHHPHDQKMGLGGRLRWMSSERQFADGFTKFGTRQLLADRLRYGKVKYTWDPDYVASKRKGYEERQQSRQEFGGCGINYDECSSDCRHLLPVIINYKHPLASNYLSKKLKNIKKYDQGTNVSDHIMKASSHQIQA